MLSFKFIKTDNDKKIEFNSLHFPEIFVKSLGVRQKTEEMKDEVRMPFRSESLHRTDGTRKPYIRTISIIIKKNLHEIIHKLYGFGILEVSSEPLHFYKVDITSVIVPNRLINDAFEVEINLSVQPYAYLKKGLREVDIKNIKEFKNIGTEICCPIYKLKGSGKGFIFLSGQSEGIAVDLTSDFIYIDTDLCVAYTDKVGELGSSITGDPEKVRLLPGYNSITVSNEVTEAYMIPNFRDL